MIYLTEEQIEALKLHGEYSALNFKGKPENNSHFGCTGDFRERANRMYNAFVELTGLLVWYDKILKQYGILDIGKSYGEIKVPDGSQKIESAGAAWGESFLEAYENLLYKKEGNYCTYEDYLSVQGEKIMSAMEEQDWIEYDEDSWCSPEDAIKKHGYKYDEDGKLVKKENIDYLKEKLNL